MLYSKAPSFTYIVNHILFRFLKSTILLCSKYKHHNHSDHLYKRALILSKRTKWEFETTISGHFNSKQDIKLHDNRGNWLFERCISHKNTLNSLVKSLNDRNICLNVVDFNSYTNELVDSADIIFSIGGDGTFFLAASKILQRDKLIVGINSDPTASEGSLCLDYKWSSHLPLLIDRLLYNDQKFLYRQRIRTIFTPSPYSRSAVKIGVLQPALSLGLHSAGKSSSELADENVIDKTLPFTYPIVTKLSNGAYEAMRLPIHALNDVFVYRTPLTKASYYEISVDGSPMKRQKSSGLLVCTGTGSSSWYSTAKRLQPNTIFSLLSLVSSSCRTKQSPSIESTLHKLSHCLLGARGSLTELASFIAHQYNSGLLFDPESLHLAYHVRDPIQNRVYDCNLSGDFINKIVIRSLMPSAFLCLDGNFVVPFEDGAMATFSLYPEDAIRCVHIPFDVL